MSEIEELEIRDVDLGNVDDLINLCIPSERRDDPLLLEGIRVKRRWAAQAIERYGNIGKIAYLNSEPAGLIQYQPKIEEKLVEIACIFVPEEENLRKGTGKEGE